MQSISMLLEAGLLDNSVQSAVLDSFNHAFGNLSLAEISSDCCSSNNYPETPQQ